MCEYKSEVLEAGIRWTKGRATETDASKLDELINARFSEGWELVTYCYTTEALNFSASVLITFRRKK